MGTRSRIAVMHGTVCKSVYCHWDCYLAFNGRLLQANYDSSKANQLVALGDLSRLRANIGEKHAFSKFELPAEEQDAFELATEDMCTFFVAIVARLVLSIKWITLSNSSSTAPKAVALSTTM